jgi:hypothetical protein
MLDTCRANEPGQHNRDASGEETGEELALIAKRHNETRSGV